MPLIHHHVKRKCTAITFFCSFLPLLLPTISSPKVTLIQAAALGLEGSGGSQILQHRISLPLEVGGGKWEKDHLERGYTVVSCRLFITNVMQDCSCIYCLHVNHSMDSHACAENHTCALQRHFLHFDRQLACSSCLVFAFFISFFFFSLTQELLSVTAVESGGVGSPARWTKTVSQKQLSINAWKKLINQ